MNIPDIGYRKFFRRLYYMISIPRHLRDNFLTLNDSDLELLDRFESHRMIEIPWLDSVKSLKNSKILEIGCGHGSSTVTLAEQGVVVTAIDVDEELINAARKRCDNHKLEVEFHLLNAQDVGIHFSGRVFDFIIFWAALEHMTLEERLLAIKGAYDILSTDGMLCIIGTPNRLHYLDTHTSELPFFNWLPDNLAVLFASYSSRNEFADNFKELNNISDKMLELYRWGRGVSFHEILLALKPINNLNIISSLDIYERERRKLFYFIYRFFLVSKFEKHFQKQFPEIHPCLFRPYLNFIIKK
jgi:2-polyprenyl-3-methyl-5-hydroxy-6-metoxy-1,4-benzoquinol methylase